MLPPTAKRKRSCQADQANRRSPTMPTSSRQDNKTIELCSKVILLVVRGAVAMQPSRHQLTARARAKEAQPTRRPWPNSSRRWALRSSPQQIQATSMLQPTSCYCSHLYGDDECSQGRRAWMVSLRQKAPRLPCRSPRLRRAIDESGERRGSAK